MQPVQQITASQLSKILSRMYPVITTRTFDYNAPTLLQRIYGRLFGPRLEIKQSIPDRIANLKRQKATVEGLIDQNETICDKYFYQLSQARAKGTRQNTAKYSILQTLKNDLELNRVYDTIWVELQNAQKRAL
jgi:hypothetical protein